MARLPRLYAPGCAQHIIQRGSNRQACFFDTADYTVYLDKLHEFSEKFEVAIHAYVLMTNHVHLLATPADEFCVSKMMQSLGRYYVRYVNTVYRRTGTLWEGRYKSTIVDTENYILTVYRYIELNPVRANMVDHASSYPWSSFQANGVGKQINLISPHETYVALGKTDEERRATYVEMFKGRMPEVTLSTIRDSTNKGWVLGEGKFKAQIATAVNRRIKSLGKGGDRKSKYFKASR
ncbi:transposase [Aurantivibrio infirmus]